jgi:hypothetical protein
LVLPLYIAITVPTNIVFSTVFYGARLVVSTKEKRRYLENPFFAAAKVV